ncbi:hypothetical protein MTR67_052567 [Solanum verrucosum]|uniref:F-box domain-containing protein n=1 Tax=Solanum verrucosum TaxID=315347 RepID=A0AAF0V6E0_SOLVR|nr:hypothetical protein MTR67_052567 [Solanum verrucosum]
MATNNGEDFPEDLIREILLRLPVKSLLRFKRICKNWYTLIKNPSFIREHLNFSKNNPPQLLIYDYGAPGDFPPITFISDYGIDAPTHEVNPQSFEGMTNLLGSLDGLFFLEREINNDVLCALWNPATREVRDLLSAVGIKFESFFSSNRFFGFGLDVLTTDYKVVYYNCKNENTVVYSCSRDSWRVFKHENVCDNRNAECVDTFYGSTTYLNGSYYWMLRENVNFNFTFKFLSFNFGNEVFEVIEGPPHDCAIRSWTADLMILDGSIVILNEVDMFIYYVWVMIQPGVWNKLATFDCFLCIKSCCDNSLIWSSGCFGLISYNVKTKKTRYLEFHHPCLGRSPTWRGFGIYYYKESLVTIKRQENG